MAHPHRVLAALLTLAIPAGCQPGAEPDIDRIHAARSRLEQAYNGRDVETLVTVLTDDVIFLPPGSPPMVGRTNVVAMHQAAFRQSADQYASELAHSSAEVIVAGDWAMDRGSYVASIAPSDGSATSRYDHNYVYIWARQPDGGWKLRRAIANLAPRSEGG